MSTLNYDGKQYDIISIAQLDGHWAVDRIVARKMGYQEAVALARRLIRERLWGGRVLAVCPAATWRF